MKKVIKIFLCIFIMIISILILKKAFYIGSDNVVIKNKDLNCSILYKGLKGAVDFVGDEKGNLYIAYKDRIQYIDMNGKSYDVLKDKSFDIGSIEFYKEKLYFTSKDKVYSYDLKKNEKKELMNDIPNYGDYDESIIKIFNDYLFLTIGAATNSGVVGKDNSWLSKNPYMHDISPKTITLKGVNFGEDKTGAFQSYKTKSIKGQIVPEHYPGNGSIVIYNIKNGNNETYAWGLRNIKGLDFNNEDKLIASVGGMEDRGSRPVKGDCDYMYQIQKGSWYGWPDYSGGDPVTSPKFKESNKLQFILENHPSTNPPAPMYQHKGIGVLGSIAIDRNGTLGSINNVYFMDNGNNKLYSVNSNGIQNKEEIQFSLKGNIKGLKFNNKGLKVLDTKEGYLYNVEKAVKNNNSFINKNIIYYLMISAVITVIILIKMYKE